MRRPFELGHRQPLPSGPDLGRPEPQSGRPDLLGLLFTVNNIKEGFISPEN